MNTESFEVFKIPDDFINRHYNCDNDLQEYRTAFMRDRDRAMYCTAFRRLAGKTQIYTIGGDDHKKNRLTHSLEVAQIARTISHALKLDENLAEAIALGHDFGHTPFGHAGEQMLHEIMLPCSKYVKNSPFFEKNVEEMRKALERESKYFFQDDITLDNFLNSIFGFKHNIQSVRVAAYLEDSYRGKKDENIGLNLTNYTLWGMLNHSSIKYKPNALYPNCYFARLAKEKRIDNCCLIDESDIQFFKILSLYCWEFDNKLQRFIPPADCHRKRPTGP